MPRNIFCQMIESLTVLTMDDADEETEGANNEVNNNIIINRRR